MVMVVGTKKASGPVPHPSPQEGGAGPMREVEGLGQSACLQQNQALGCQAVLCLFQPSPRR